MRSEEFIQLLEARNPLPIKVVKKLREQLAQKARAVSEQKIADALVAGGHLSRYQADRLLVEIEAESAKNLLPEADKDSPDGAAQDDLGFAMVDDDPPEAAVPKREVTQDRPSSPEPRPRHSPMRSAWNVDREPLVVDASLAQGVKPPLEDLDDLFGPASGHAGTSSGLGPASATWRSRRRRGQGWDSKLILLGGGALLILSLLAVGLLFSLRRENAGNMLSRAEEDYSSQSYSQAITKYTAFLTSFPQHSEASYARVRIGLARLRLAVEGSNNWSRSLESATNILTEIAEEKDFSRAADDLAALLPAIVSGLMNDARSAVAKMEQQANPDEAATSVEAARQTAENLRNSIALVERYVRGERLDESKLRDAESELATLERTVLRGGELAASLREMRSAIDQGKPESVYSLGRLLESKYAELADVPAIAEMARLAATKLPDRVAPLEFSPKENAAMVASPRGGWSPYWTSKSTGSASGGEVFAFPADGAVYAINTATGELLWRRPVGWESLESPLELRGESGSILLVDSQSWRLLRLAKATGEVEWEQAIGEPFAIGGLAESAAYAALSSGALLKIDTGSGSVVAGLRFPQELCSSPVILEGRDAVVVVGEHSHLFVVKADLSACLQAHYVGHSAGSVLAPPAVIPGYTIVAENHRLDAAQIHVLRLDEDAHQLAEVQTLPLAGKVTTPMETQGRRLAVATDLGALYVFEVDTGSSSGGLRKLVERPASVQEPADHFVRMRDTDLFVASRQLALYQAQVTRARLDSKWIFAEGNLFTGPPRLERSDVIADSREAHGVGHAVQRFAMDNPVSPKWSTLLAVPLSGTPWLDQGYLCGLTRRGDYVRVQPKDKVSNDSATKDSATVAVIRPRGGIRQDIASEWDMLVYRDDRRSIWASVDTLRFVYEVHAPSDGASDAQARWLELPARKSVACTPVWFQNGLLYGDSAGLVHWVNSETGEPLGEAFLPPLQPGKEVHWFPATVSLDGQTAIVADGDLRLFRLAVQDSPIRGLIAVSERELVDPPAAPPVILGQAVYLIDSHGQAIGLRLDTLETVESWPIEGEVHLPPCTVDGHVFVGSDRRLYCFDADHRLIWSAELGHGPLSAPPASVDGGILYTTADGTVVRLDAADGRELGAARYGIHFATSPLVQADRAYIGGSDGTIHEVEIP